MAREFGVRSYKPEEIEFTNNCSSFGAFGQPWRILNHPLYQNIFLEVYDTPETAEELAIALGVALPYMQSELDFLVRETFLSTVETAAGVKYQTAFPIISREAWQACNKRQVELQDELADLLETLVDRYVTLCHAHGVTPYRGGQDYETAKWTLLMQALDTIQYETFGKVDLHGWWTKRPDGGQWDIIGYQGKTNAMTSDGKNVINIPEYFVGLHGAPRTKVIFQQYKFYYKNIHERTPEFLDDTLADVLGEIVRAEATGTPCTADPACLKELAKIGYLRPTEEGYQSAVLHFDMADRTAAFTPAEREELRGLVARVREIILGLSEYAKGILTADLPAHLRGDEHILALVSMSTGFRRELILHRALSDGWLTDTGDLALGAFVRMSLQYGFPHLQAIDFSLPLPRAWAQAPARGFFRASRNHEDPHRLTSRKQFSIRTNYFPLTKTPLCDMIYLWDFHRDPQIHKEIARSTEPLIHYEKETPQRHSRRSADSPAGRCPPVDRSLYRRRWRHRNTSDHRSRGHPARDRSPHRGAYRSSYRSGHRARDRASHRDRGSRI